MSRVIRFHKVGGPEVLQIDELVVPPPGPGEVRISVKALGLNRAESAFRSGKYLEEPQFPSRLGYEAAGTVESLGSGVSGFSPGDAVSVVPPLGMGQYGTYGELITLPSSFVVKHPASLSFVEAAAVWMQYLTAYGALIDIAKLTKGDFVVIPAASSSVGLAAIEIANSVGAVPIATTRKSDKRDALLKAGALHVIATEEQDLAATLKKITGDKGARVVFDPVGGPTINALAEGMSTDGILILYGALSPEPTPFPQFAALSKRLTMRGYIIFELYPNPSRIDGAKRFILDGLSAGKLKPIIAKTFPFEQIVEAHRYLKSNQQVGKIVVTV